MGKNVYEKLQKEIGIYRHVSTKNYLATKKHMGRSHQKTFNFLNEAKEWQKSLPGNTKASITSQNTATLKNV